MGYDEINLNVGCPSDRVQSGRFGACLMREPELVADCMAAIKGAVAVPATVKCRIGVDDQDPAVSLFATVDACAAVGIDDLHRPCPQGLAEGSVAQGKPRRAAAGLCAGAAAEARAAASDRSSSTAASPRWTRPRRIWTTPTASRWTASCWAAPPITSPACWVRSIGGCSEPRRRTSMPSTAIERYKPYLAARLEEGVALHAMTRHMLGLMHGRPGARAFRRILTVEAIAPAARAGGRGPRRRRRARGRGASRAGRSGGVTRLR